MLQAAVASGCRRHSNVELQGLRLQKARAETQNAEPQTTLSFFHFFVGARHLNVGEEVMSNDPSTVSSGHLHRDGGWD